MGAGDDTFVWNPGDGSDTVEGQAGFDTMLFNGANIDEKIDISANGGRVRFTRDVANVTMDLNGVEGIDFNALGGADTITVNDLSGTDVTEVNLDLGGRRAWATARPTPSSSTAPTATTWSWSSATRADVGVLGLAAQVNITGAEAGERPADGQRPGRRRRGRGVGPGGRRDPAHGGRRRRRRRPDRRRRETTCSSAAPATTS